jgi:hypothetical protein
VFYVLGTMTILVGEERWSKHLGSFVLVPGGLTQDLQNSGDAPLNVSHTEKATWLATCRPTTSADTSTSRRPVTGITTNSA